MIYKSYILEQSLQTINNLKMFLFYGENHGLKKEFKVNIKDLNKDREILNLFQEEVIKNKNILINDGKLSYTETKSQQTITKKYIIEKLTDYFKSEKKAKDIASLLYDNREVKFKSSLKRLKK